MVRSRLGMAEVDPIPFLMRCGMSKLATGSVLPMGFLVLAVSLQLT